jgi:hypothetical protein
MAWYLTRYRAWHPDSPPPVKGRWVGHYSMFIWARSMPDAWRKAKARNIGERVECVWQRKGVRPYELPSVLLTRRRLTPRQRIDVIHAVIFLAYLVGRSQKAQLPELIGDEGLVHMTAHCLAFGWPTRKKLAPHIRRYERRVPGYLGPRPKPIPR